MPDCRSMEFTPNCSSTKLARESKNLRDSVVVVKWRHSENIVLTIVKPKPK